MQLWLDKIIKKKTRKILQKLHSSFKSSLDLEATSNEEGAQSTQGQRHLKSTYMKCVNTLFRCTWRIFQWPGEMVDFGWPCDWWTGVVFIFAMSFVTTVVLILFGLYIVNSVYVIYNLFHVPTCQGGTRQCLKPHGIIDKKLEVS